MTSIIFEDLHVGPRRIDVRARTSGAVHDLWFEMNQDVPVTFTSVAVGLSTLCGRAFESVRFDFPVADSGIKTILQLTQAGVSATHTDPAGTPHDGALSSVSAEGSTHLPLAH